MVLKRPFKNVSETAPKALAYSSSNVIIRELAIFRILIFEFSSSFSPK